MKQEMIGWQCHHPDHMQIIHTSFQTDNHTSTSSLIFTGLMLILMPNSSVRALKAIKAVKATYSSQKWP